MVWFNEEKQVGKIETDDGDRFAVSGADFVAGHPVGRCSNLPVVFDAVGDQAMRVEVIEADEVRRARRRSSGRSL